MRGYPALDLVLKVKRMRNSALPLPAYHSAGAAGMDLLADVDAAITLQSRTDARFRPGLRSRFRPVSRDRCARAADARCARA